MESRNFRLGPRQAKVFPLSPSRTEIVATTDQRSIPGTASAVTLAFVGIPFYSLAEYRGMGEAVKSLRNAGILERMRSAKVSVTDLGDVDCPRIREDHGPKNLQNYEEFLEGTRSVRDRLSQGANESTLTFCLGGECTFIVGSLAALKPVYKGRPGIVWMDAHGDFNIPETTPSGFIGGMCLAMACGRGPKLPAEMEIPMPLLDEECAVHVGSRSFDPGEDEALRDSVQIFPASEVLKSPGEVARKAARHLNDSSDWIIAHLDVDIFDPSVMPGVDFPEPGGLSTRNVMEIFRELQSTGKLKVVNLTAYNPTRDIDKRGQSLLLDLAPRLVEFR